MAARSEAKADKAIASLRSEHPEIRERQISWLKLDLSDVKSIVDAANELKSRETKLDILGTSSASVLRPRTQTDEM